MQSLESRCREKLGGIMREVIPDGIPYRFCTSRCTDTGVLDAGFLSVYLMPVQEPLQWGNITAKKPDQSDPVDKFLNISGMTLEIIQQTPVIENAYNNALSKFMDIAQEYDTIINLSASPEQLTGMLNTELGNAVIAHVHYTYGAATGVEGTGYGCETPPQPANKTIITVNMVNPAQVYTGYYIESLDAPQSTR